MPSITTDAEFEALSDARTMMEFVEIQKDPKRLAKAKKQLKKMETDAAEASRVRKVAGKLKKLRSS